MKNYMNEFTAEFTDLKNFNKTNKIIKQIQEKFRIKVEKQSTGRSFGAKLRRYRSGTNIRRHLCGALYAYYSTAGYCYDNTVSLLLEAK